MAARSGAAVQASGLRKAYGTLMAVEEVSFEVGEGEIFGLLGPNGSGKTTTVEMLQGLRRPDAGTVRVFGLDPQADSARVRRLVGSQLQGSALPDRLKVWEALRLFSALAGTGPPWQRLLEQWGLDRQRNAAFASLSGGQAQRLFVALALVGDPKVVVLDEMTTGLDPASRRVAWDLVEAVRDSGTTVILVTHSMDEAARLCDRLAVLAHGRIAAEGTPTSLVERNTRPDVSFSTDPRADLGFLEHVDGVAEVIREGPRVTVRGTGPLLARTALALAQHGIEPFDLQSVVPTLEDAYLAVTNVDVGVER